MHGALRFIPSLGGPTTCARRLRIANRQGLSLPPPPAPLQLAAFSLPAAPVSVCAMTIRRLLWTRPTPRRTVAWAWLTTTRARYDVHAVTPVCLCARGVSQSVAMNLFHTPAPTFPTPVAADSRECTAVDVHLHGTPRAPHTVPDGRGLRLRKGPRAGARYVRHLE
jgi:hypothetical protein